MARPTKEGLDYFPLDVDIFEDEKIEAISGEFGIKGELAVIKLLCAVYKKGYFVVWNDLTQAQLLKRLPGISKELLNQIVDRLVTWGFFDKSLFNSAKVLTSRNIQFNFFEATKRRKGKKPTQYVINGVNVDINPQGKVVNVDINPQSRVKESKVKQINTHNNKYDDNGGDDLDFAYPKKAACEQEVSKASEVEAYFIQEVKGCPCSPGEQIAITKALKDFSMEDIKAGIDAVKGRGISSFKYVLAMLRGQKKDEDRAKKLGLQGKTRQGKTSKKVLKDDRYTTADLQELIDKKLLKSRTDMEV